MGEQQKRILLLLLFIVNISLTQANIHEEILIQSERRIPVMADVDVLVIGGTVPAVSAAISAAEKGTIDIIWNEENNPAGVIIANRAGRQAVVAKTFQGNP